MHLSRFALSPFLLLLAACGPAPDPNAAANAKAQQDAAAAEDSGRQIDGALASENWTLARAQCDVLGFRHPDSAVTQRLKAACADAKSRADAAGESARLAGLWAYQSQAVGKRKQYNASIFSKDTINTGAGRSNVRLIFRDHPEWGRSSYLVLDNGDFDCYGGCQLKMSVDGKARTMAGSRPKTDEAIAMFVEDERALWRIVRDAKTLSITLPLKGASPQQAEFEVGGLDPSSMQGW